MFMIIQTDTDTVYVKVSLYDCKVDLPINEKKSLSMSNSSIYTL